MVLLCVGFLFVFFVFLEREKIEGVLKILGFLTESDSFSPKKSEKTYLTNRALHVTFLLLNRRARSNAPFEHARKHTHKKKEAERRSIACALKLYLLR